GGGLRRHTALLQGGAHGGSRVPTGARPRRVRGRPAGRLPAATGCSLLSTVILLPLGLPAYAWMGGLALALWGALLPGYGAALSGGVLSGLAPFFRWDLAPAVAGVAAVVALECTPRERRRFLAGFALGLAPYAVLLW